MSAVCGKGRAEGLTSPFTSYNEESSDLAGVGVVKHEILIEPHYLPGSMLHDWDTLVSTAVLALREVTFSWTVF